MPSPKISLTKNARTVLALRYLEKDARGRPKETPEDLFRRVAKNISLADAPYRYRQQVTALLQRYNEPFFQVVKRKEFLRLIKHDAEIKKTKQAFYEMMRSQDFLPNSPTLFNAGRTLQQLAACFVLPVEDNLDAIFMAVHHTALIHQSGGGTGFSFSRLRPKGDLVESTQGAASGSISFMKIFDCATEQIKQGGKRRGANMGILRVDHPDNEEFITCKSRENILPNFNISVGITDGFMRAYRENKAYAVINPRTGKVVGRKNARKIFHLIAQEAWKTADPGVIFLDTINRTQPTPQLGDIESTNPCAEVPLLPYEACNLGSINLAHFVKDGAVDYERLRTTVWNAVHFLDNVIDMSNYPLPEIREIVQGNRKIGVGVMGFADMLVQLGISYVSDEALIVAEKVMACIAEEAKKASVALAKVRGVFPNFTGSRYDTGRKEDRVRNATRTSIAPTGTIAIIAGCSSGIEPLFALAFTHRIVETKQVTEINRHFLAAAKKHKMPRSLVEKVIRQGTLEKLPVSAEFKKLFVVANQVPAAYHVRMQAAFQKYVDNAVSKTVNLPKSATPKDIEKIYLLA
ncbi:MAG: adenosylcobalamin-dependent ribonucleoside-diphosphate reductase, partial [Nanoarchaeota archaeon]|nr:adenosylcobalamin-dependent ribonucleoside-diphosphate reductase [Nanoarchaeota archaeon]